MSFVVWFIFMLLYFTLRRTVWVEFIIIFDEGAIIFHWQLQFISVAWWCWHMRSVVLVGLHTTQTHTCAEDAHMRRRRTHAQKHWQSCSLFLLLAGLVAWWFWHMRGTQMTRVNYSLDPLRPSILRRWFLTTMLYVTMILHNTVTMRRSARIEVFSLDTDVHTYRVTYIQSGRL